MLDIAKSESKKFMYNACEKYAEKVGKKVDDIQLLLGLKLNQVPTGQIQDGKMVYAIALENSYHMCEDYEPKEEYTFNQVLGVKINFGGSIGNMAIPFIQTALVRLAKENGIELDKVKVMCVPSLVKNESRFAVKKYKKNISLFLYNDSELVQTIYAEGEGFPDEFEEGMQFQVNGINFSVAQEAIDFYDDIAGEKIFWAWKPGEDPIAIEVCKKGISFDEIFDEEVLMDLQKQSS